VALSQVAANLVADPNAPHDALTPTVYDDSAPDVAIWSTAVVRRRSNGDAKSTKAMVMVVMMVVVVMMPLHQLQQRLGALCIGHVICHEYHTGILHGLEQVRVGLSFRQSTLQRGGLGCAHHAQCGDRAQQERRIWSHQTLPGCIAR